MLKRFLGQAVSRKSAITPSILHAAWDSFDFSIPLHAAMRALFLVAFFTFLRKSNLIPDYHPGPFEDYPVSATLFSLAHTLAAWVSSLPHLRPTSSFIFESGSEFCSPFHSFNAVGPTAHYLQALFFGTFLSRVVSGLHLDPSLFSPCSFRRGGATFALDCHIPYEIIKLQGD